MRSNQLAVSVSNLTKSYRLFGHPGDRIKEFLSLGLKQYHRKFTALQGVSFDIKKGEAIGIVGCNGSGKSTLLQLLCGILKPTTGSVQINGRISALLELGAGFNPEFTGRENVYFQGALMGVTKAQVDERFDDIAAFADIGKFIDLPVRTYSSGMFVRLAFASMIHADADILIIDEALAVGDEAFQRKCFNRLSEYLGGGSKTLIFVSHNLVQVDRVCTRTIWINNGHLVENGPTADVCSAYQRYLDRQVLSGYQSAGLPLAKVVDSGEVAVLGISLLHDGSDMPVSELEMHSAARIVVDFRCAAPLEAVEIVVGFHTTDMTFIAASSTDRRFPIVCLSPGEHKIECRFPIVSMLPGVYQVRLAFYDQYRRGMWVANRLCGFRVIPAGGVNFMHNPLGLVDMPSEWSLSTAEEGGAV